MAIRRSPLPATLPEFPAAGDDAFDVLALVDQRPTPERGLSLETPHATGEVGESGVQPIARAWQEVHQQLQAAFGECDNERALMLAEAYLRHDSNDSFALLCVEECRMSLEAQLAGQLAPLDRVVVLRLSLRDLTHARLDHRAGFLMSRVDGRSTIEDLIDVAGMPRLDALRFIRDWVEQGFVSLE